jgi:S1-C subfamily serine protease
MSIKYIAAIVAALSLHGCVAGAPAYGADWPTPDMNRVIDNTNYSVNAGCSGTLIDTTGHILTAAHCVEDQYETVEQEKISDEGVVTKEKVRRLRDGTVSRITFAGSEAITTTTHRVKLVAVNKDKDLALLQVKGFKSGDPAVIACSTPVRGAKVYIVGNPMGILYSSVTQGIVSSLQRDYGTLRLPNQNPRQSLMQISGGVIGGNSGGAVYNVNGEFVGVPVLAHRINEVIGFAAPLEDVKTFLTANKLEGLFERCTATP